jgi:hypothetical protein
VEGTREGLAATNNRGRNGARPHKLTMRQIKQINQMFDQRTAENRPVWNVTAIAPTLRGVPGRPSTSSSTNADLAARIAGR